MSGTISRSQKKMNKKAEEKRLSAQKSIPYREMARDGICRVQDKYYSKTIRFYDINYQLAQNEDKNAIFENWCDFLNYFDSSIHFQLSFINHHSNMKEFESVIQIKPRHDAFDDVRMEYAQMLKNQLAKGNNGLVRTKYITFGIEAENIREAKPKLERIETDILNNFKVLGVSAYPLDGRERLQIMYETFNPEEKVPFQFSFDQVLRSGMGTKDFIAPTSFLFKNGKDFMMGNTIGAVSYLQILAPELTDRMLAEFLDMDRNLIVNLHIQSLDRLSFSDIEQVKKLCQRLRVISAGASADHDGILPGPFFCVQRDSRQIQNLQDIGVAHLILDGDAQEVKLPHRILGLQRKQRDLFFPHDLVKIGPWRIHPLAPDVISAIEHIVEDLDSQMGHTDLVNVRKTHGKADIHLILIFHHRIYFTADITGRFLNL